MKESDGADYLDEQDAQKLESTTKYNTKMNEMTEQIMRTVDLESVCDSKQRFMIILQAVLLLIIVLKIRGVVGLGSAAFIDRVWLSNPEALYVE